MATPDRPRVGDEGLPSARWAAVRPLVDAALELPPAERAAYLAGACAGDDGLRADAERWLQACERVGNVTGFLAEPAAVVGAPLLAASVDVPDAVVASALADEYDVERELGRGGMAIVYLARDRRHGRLVAVKVMRPELRAFMSAERFLQEIRVTAGLAHPHILPLHASGERDGLLFYVMPYVEGETLRQRLAREQRLAPEVVVRLLREVAGALDHAHRRGVVHRDIKPENVLLQDGHAIVADFGIARAVTRARGGDDDGDATLRTMPGEALGTPAYMAPEQALGDSTVDHRADLYALGLVAYEALDGAHPFGARSAAAMALAQCTETPAPLAERRPDAPPELAALVARLLEKDPAARPQSAADVVRALDESPVAVAAVRRPAATARAPRRGARFAAGGALAVVAVAALLLWRGGATVGAAGGSRAPVRATAAATVSPAAARPSLAVLPFANTGGDSADAHFSDGLTDELIGALGRVPGLRVIGRTSSFALRDAGVDVRAIADTLKVGSVLEGSVRRAGGRLRVVAQLVSAGDGAILWSETYDRESRDVFAVQEEIARAIAGALRLRLTPGAAALVGRPTGDSAAYELYLRGRYVFNTQLGREGTLRALRYFEQAAARDPAFARAHAGRSDAYARLAIFGYGRPRELFPRAREAALRAIALDPMLAEAHVSLAHVLFVHDFDADSSDRVFRRALALEPGYTFGRVPFAVSLGGRERFVEALAQLDTARASDPLAAGVLNMRGRILVSARRPDLAIAALREALELNPQLDLSYQQLGHAYLQQGRHADAIVALQRAAALSGPRDSAQLAYVYAATGDGTAARRIVQALLNGPADRYVPPFHVAMAYAGLGDVDEAFRWLERAYVERDPFVGSARVTAAFAPLHGDPRWRLLLRRMGLER